MSSLRSIFEAHGKPPRPARAAKHQVADSRGTGGLCDRSKGAGAPVAVAAAAPPISPTVPDPTCVSVPDSCCSAREGKLCGRDGCSDMSDAVSESLSSKSSKGGEPWPPTSLASNDAAAAANLGPATAGNDASGSGVAIVDPATAQVKRHCLQIINHAGPAAGFMLVTMHALRTLSPPAGFRSRCPPHRRHVLPQGPDADLTARLRQDETLAQQAHFLAARGFDERRPLPPLLLSLCCSDTNVPCAPVHPLRWNATFPLAHG